MNGEHQKIYDRIDQVHGRITDLVKEFSMMHGKVDVICDTCKTRERRIHDLESKVYKGIGGIMVLGILLTIITITKTLGLW